MALRYLLTAVAAPFLFTACEKIDFSSAPTENTAGNSSERATLQTFDTNCHVIALSDTIAEDKVNVIYISLQQWDGMTSTYSDNTAAAALSAAASYREGDLTGWRIPSRDEIKRIKNFYDTYEEQFSLLNSKLEQMGAQPIGTTDSNGKTCRYLCANGDSTFSMLKGYSILKAGASVKYRLRLIKDSIHTIVPSTIYFTY